MAVELVPVSLSVPKESKAMTDAVTDLVKHFKNGGTVVAADQFLGEIFTAVAGLSALGAEVSDAHNADAAAYLVKRTFGVFQP